MYLDELNVSEEMDSDDLDFSSVFDEVSIDDLTIGGVSSLSEGFINPTLR